MLKNEGMQTNCLPLKGFEEGLAPLLKGFSSW